MKKPDDKGREQREMIRAFEAAFYETTSNGMGPVTMLGIILFEIIITCILCIPFSMEDIKVFIICGMSLAPWPVWLYMNRFLVITEGGKSYRIAEKLCYLPVDRRELWRVHLGYLMHFLRIPFACGMAAQILVALLANRRLTWGNLLCPLIVAGVYPFVIGLTMIHERK